jgi:aspartyl-tRNA synthetase
VTTQANPTPLSMRTMRCGEVRASNIGQQVVLCGWVGKRREHGEHLAFIDLRDYTGIIQCVVEGLSLIHI